jgi:hypothetical protein
MEYNTQRNQLVIAEYGRNIQKMIEQCIEIEDRKKRTKTAELIVEVMAQMTPKVKESGDFKQKLWDHLHIIADFKLDVDSPYPKPEPNVLNKKPEPLSYSENNIQFRHYGRVIEGIIEKAATYEDGPEKDQLVHNIANHLKKSYLNWNRNSVDDDLILKHLELLSGGKLELQDDQKLSHTSEILARNKKKKYPSNQNQYKSKGKRK